MKIKAFIKYTEGYLPTPRHRKLRYKNLEEYVDIELKEVTKNDIKIAYIIDNELEIIKYGNKYYKKLTKNKPFYCGDSDKNDDNESLLGRLKYSFVGFSSYYGFNEEDSKSAMINKAQADLNRYLLIDEELYVVTGEPMFRILTFGLGQNHGGIGTYLTVKYGMDTKRNDGVFFKHNERDNAIEKALNIATRRGDTDSIEHIKRAPIIEAC